MGVSSKPRTIRYITMPCKSHPSTERIDKELNKVKTWVSSVSLSNLSADIICSGLSEITVLYECFDELVKISLSQTSSCSGNQTKKWTDELLDTSVIFLDICSNATDLLSQTQQNQRDLGCDLRRSCSMEHVISKYVLFKNKLEKDLKRSVVSLRKLDNMIVGSSLIADSENYHQMSLIRVFREVNALSTAIFQLLFVFLAIPLLKKRPTRRWTVVSRFLSSRKVVPEVKADTNENELQCFHAALLTYSGSYKHEFIQIVQKKQETLEASLESINAQLVLMLRRQIAVRSSLLNMVSFY